MTDAGPAAVRRHLLRPLPWLVATVVLSGLLLLADALEQREHARELADALRLKGTVARSYRGGAYVPVSYYNPLTEQRVRTELYVLRVALPAAGRPVDLEVDRDDPGHVVLAGDRFTVAENLPFTVMWPAIPLAAMAARWRGARRSRRVAASTTAFVMLGALAPAWRLGRSCRLHLFPLDAPPGAAPVCTVPVVTTGGLPVPSATFEVEVRGVPRVAGRVVARAGDVVLWPASRAVGSSRATRPVATEVPAAVALDPVELLAPPRPPVPWTLLAPEAAAWSMTVLLLLGVTAATVRAAGVAERRAEDSVRTVARVLEADPVGSHVVVELIDPETGRKRKAAAPVDWPEDHPVGRRYPVLVAAGDGVRLAREPYDAGEPVAWAAVPVVVASCLLARRGLRVRASRRALRTGPYHEATAWPLPGGPYTKVGIGQPGRPLRAVVPVPGDPVGTGRRVVVAGDVVPGAPVALVVDGRPVIAAGPCQSPPWPPGPGHGWRGPG
ncbi:MAG TPA: hypothetical protein VFO65_05420 [Acidimicrobiales bacterium]|nr:hypothetical protein [Acidimicrobiales bacterium]